MNFNPNITRSTKNQTTSEQQSQVTDEPVAPIEVEETSEVIEEPVVNTYTFPNGLVVNTGFKLNEQQSHALDVLSDFVLNPAKYDDQITLAGYAGTGKTTILKFLHKYIESIGGHAGYAAPTHRAKVVINQSNPDAHAQTLHRYFGLQPEIDITKDTLDLKNLITNFDKERIDKLAVGGLLIIDESSMLDDVFYDFI